MNKTQLNNFINLVCISYSEQWCTYNSGALESVVERHAIDNGYTLSNEPLRAIYRMCRTELKNIYNII